MKVKVCCKVIYIRLEEADQEYAWHDLKLLLEAVGTIKNRTMVMIVSLVKAVRLSLVKPQPKDDDVVHQDRLNMSVTFVKR